MEGKRARDHFVPASLKHDAASHDRAAVAGTKFRRAAASANVNPPSPPLQYQQAAVAVCGATSSAAVAVSLPTTPTRPSTFAALSFLSQTALASDGAHRQTSPQPTSEPMLSLESVSEAESESAAHASGLASPLRPAAASVPPTPSRPPQLLPSPRSAMAPVPALTPRKYRHPGRRARERARVLAGGAARAPTGGRERQLA